MKLQRNRQVKTSFLILLFAVFLLPLKISAQEKEKYKNCIYAKKSNILSPDTLKGDQKKIFWHFVELTHEEAKKLEPLKVKSEIEKLGISSKDQERFGKACVFFYTSMKNHKYSCQQWESFKDLSPKSK